MKVLRIPFIEQGRTDEFSETSVTMTFLEGNVVFEST